MIIVDSHCHLDDTRFNKPLNELLKQANEAGVNYIQTICTTRADFPIIHKMALENERVFCSFGIHPHHAAEDKVSTEEIIGNLKKDKVIAIGETGLDYYYDNSPRDIQKESFHRHLAAARIANVPVIIHSRDAEEDTIKIIEDALKEGELKLLLHCFSGSINLAKWAVEKGIFISASGIITFKKAESIRDTLKIVPPELLLVETDAPYLAPIPHRGKTNEPAYTKYVLEELASIKEVLPEKMAKITTNNFFRLFTKAKR